MQMVRPRMHGRRERWCRPLPPLAAAALALLAIVPFAPDPAAAAADGDRDVLRVLKLSQHEANHPHRDTADEFRMISDFARRRGMTIEWSDAHHPTELYRRLIEGEGDVVVADLPRELARDARIRQSASMGTFRYYLVGHQDVEATNPLELDGYRVAVSLSSPMWPYMNRLAERLPSLSVVVLPVDTSRDTLLRGAADGRYDAAVVAMRPDERPLEEWPRLERIFELSDRQTISWYYRRDSQRLKDVLDRYMHRFHASFLAPRQALGDLDAIKRRGVLRIITRMDPQNYFVRGGQPAGFEYELVQLFTRQHGLGVEFLVGETEQQVLEWLRSGAGDLVATRVNAENVRVDPALEQSLQYFHSASVIISRSGSGIRHPEDLAGKRVAVLENTVHHRALGQLVAAGTPVDPVVINPDTPLDTMLDGIENWGIDAAIIDAYAVDDIRAGRPLIRAGASLPVQYKYAWTIRAGNPALQAAVEEFLRDQFRMETYNVLADRYFGRARFAQFTRLEHISPYDDLVRRHADAHDFDWRLIVAQMYQESHFDPGARSETGALGLMQLLPGTASDMGIRNPFDPEAAILGGVRYMSYLRDRFESQIAARERTWFALAAYNIGFGRIELARRRATEQRLDPNRWFGHVEQVMRSMASDGSGCRCGQTVVYVRAIRSLYNTYHRLRDTLTAGLVPLDGPAI